ncbi:uncharacterized protein isoform X2 [Rhodnius prolixus]|uniref:Uncharacterized protein n=1 Tax=Rhodnius prolixus TaxID=13249 RepID=T1I1N0_RHOPR
MSQVIQEEYCEASLNYEMEPAEDLQDDRTFLLSVRKKRDEMLKAVMSLPKLKRILEDVDSDSEQQQQPPPDVDEAVDESDPGSKLTVPDQ